LSIKTYIQEQIVKIVLFFFKKNRESMVLEVVKAEGAEYIGIFISDESFARNLIGVDFERTYPDIHINWAATTKAIMEHHTVKIKAGARHYFIDTV